MAEPRTCIVSFAHNPATGSTLVSPECPERGPLLGPTPERTRNGTHEDLLTAPVAEFAALTRVEADRPGALRLPKVEAARFDVPKQGRVSATTRLRNHRLDRVAREVAARLTQQGVRVGLEGAAPEDRGGLLVGQLPYQYGAPGSFVVGEIYNVLRITTPSNETKELALAYLRERHVSTDQDGLVIPDADVYDSSPSLMLTFIDPTTRSMLGSGTVLPTHALSGATQAAREAELVDHILEGLRGWGVVPAAAAPAPSR